MTKVFLKSVLAKTLEDNLGVIIKEALESNTLYKYKKIVRSLFLHVLGVRDIVLNIVEGTNDLDI